MTHKIIKQVRIPDDKLYHHLEREAKEENRNVTAQLTSILQERYLKKTELDKVIGQLEKVRQQLERVR